MQVGADMLCLLAFLNCTQQQVHRLVHKPLPLNVSTVHAFTRCIFRNEIFALLGCYAAQIGS